MWPTLQAIDKTILVACGCGLMASVVAVTQIPSWPIVMEEDHSLEPDFIKTKAAFILGLIASAASLAIGIVRMKFEASMHSKTLRLLFVSSLLASFLCLLVAVAVWGDFVKHGERNTLHRNELRWSYWVAVVAAVFQFLGFLLYIMRSDFKSGGGPSSGLGGGGGGGGSGGGGIDSGKASASLVNSNDGGPCGSGPDTGGAADGRAGRAFV